MLINHKFMPQLLLCTSFFLFLSVVELAYRNFFQPKRGRFESTLIFRHDPLLGYVLGKTGAQDF